MTTKTFDDFPLLLQWGAHPDDKHFSYKCIQCGFSATAVGSDHEGRNLTGKKITDREARQRALKYWNELAERGGVCEDRFRQWREAANQTSI